MEPIMELCFIKAQLGQSIGSEVLATPGLIIILKTRWAFKGVWTFISRTNLARPQNPSPAVIADFLYPLSYPLFLSVLCSHHQVPYIRKLLIVILQGHGGEIRKW